MRVSTKLQELQKKKEELTSKFQSLEKKEKTLEESIKILEEKLAIQEIEEKVETKRGVLKKIESKMKVLKRRLVEPQTKQAPPPMPQIRAVEEESRPRVKGSSRCGGYLGYLATLSKDEPIPRECLICPRVLDCASQEDNNH